MRHAEPYRRETYKKNQANSFTGKITLNCLTYLTQKNKK